MSCAHLQSDVDAFVDRELDPAAANTVREHLSGCAECRRRAAELDALGRTLRDAPYYVAPDRLHRQVWTHAGRRPWRSGLLAVAAAAALVVAASAGLARFGGAPVAVDAPLGDAVNAHVRSLMADHLFDVQSSDQHTVKPWFLGRLDFSPPVADLAAIGFPLVGGRLDYLEGRAVAALVYERRRHTINVFVSPSGGEGTGSTVQSVRGFQVHRWSRNGMRFVAVSDLNDVELTAFVRALQQQ